MDRIQKERELADRLRAGQQMTIDDLVREATRLRGWFLTTRNAIRCRGPNGALQCPITGVAWVGTGQYYPARDSILVAARAIGLPYGPILAGQIIHKYSRAGKSPAEWEQMYWLPRIQE